MLLALYGRIWNMVEHKNVLHLLGSPRFEINHSNEVLNIDFGQGAAKISEVKVGGRKKYLPTRLTAGAWHSVSTERVMHI